MSLSVAAAATDPSVPTSAVDEKMEKAFSLYESKLKAILEPEHNNRFIVIEPDSEEYAIANSTGDAMRALHKTHSHKPLLLMKIGPEPETEMAIRIRGAQALAKAQQK